MSTIGQPRTTTDRLRRRLLRPVPITVAAAPVAGTGALAPLLANGAESICTVDYEVSGDGFIMKAGSATEITEFDQWMLRDFWHHIKSRYGY